MTDTELFREMDILKTRLVSHQADEEELLEIVERLHEYRLEGWRRGYRTPTADKLAQAEKYLRRNIEKLAAAAEELAANAFPALRKVYLSRYYAVKDAVRDCEDRIEWIKRILNVIA